jgi:hypothetical protein
MIFELILREECKAPACNSSIGYERHESWTSHGKLCVKNPSMCKQSIMLRMMMLFIGGYF